MNKLPSLPNLEDFLARGPSEVPGEIVRRISEALGASCELLLLDIDVAHLHLAEARPELPGEQMQIVNGDGQSLSRLVLERQEFAAPREDWVGRVPLKEEHLAGIPVRALDATTGALVVGGGRPSEAAEVAALRSLGFQVGAALNLAESYADDIVSARRREKLSLAAEMQQDLLPPGELYTSRIGVVSGLEPAYDIGGDWYDYVLRDGKLFVALGDPAGKGIAAETLAAVSFATARNARRNGGELPEIMSAIHDTVRENSSLQQYATLFLAEVDLESYAVDVISAGHPAPLHIPADTSGPVRLLPVSRTHPPTGALEEPQEFQVERHHLGAGSKLLFYSDGVTERRGENGEMFGTKSLTSFAEDHREMPPLRFVRRLLGNLLSYGSEKPRDDATVVLLDLSDQTAAGCAESPAGR